MRESTPPAGRLPDEPLIGVADLAEWLGVSVHAVKKWTAQGPASGRVPLMIRVNGHIKFRPEDVRTWLKSKEIR